MIDWGRCKQAVIYIRRAARGGGGRRGLVGVVLCCHLSRVPSGGDEKMPRRYVEIVELCGTLVTRRLLRYIIKGSGLLRKLYCGKIR